jgi:hypothetical protein
MPRAKTAAKVHNFVTQPSVEAKVKRFWRTKESIINRTLHLFEVFSGR